MKINGSYSSSRIYTLDLSGKKWKQLLGKVINFPLWSHWTPVEGLCKERNAVIALWIRGHVAYEGWATYEGSFLRISKAKPRKNHFNFQPHGIIRTLCTKRSNKKTVPYWEGQGSTSGSPYHSPLRTKTTHERNSVCPGFKWKDPRTELNSTMFIVHYGTALYRMTMRVYNAN